METYISEAACRGMRPAFMNDVSLETRRFLVAKLLASRKDARLLVAPTGFGKSLLAGQYASLVYSFWHVFWIDCQDLRFLRALNEKSLHQLICQRDDQAMLAVFDDVPSLSAEQAESFWECVAALQQSGCEVIACTTPACADSFAHQGKWCMFMDQKALMVQYSERDDARIPSEAAGDNLFMQRIPALAWGGERGASCLVRGFAFDELPVEDVLAGCLLFAVGSVSASSLRRFCPQAATQLDALRQRYPYFCYSEEEDSYSTVLCDDGLFRRVLLPLVSEMSSFLEEGSPRQLLRTLADLLMDLGQGQRACWAAQMLLDPSSRKDWLAVHGLQLALSGCCGALEECVRSVARLCPNDEAALGATLALAQAIQGAPYVVSLAAPGEGEEALPLSARCIYGLLALYGAKGSRDASSGAILARLYQEAQEASGAHLWQCRLFCYGYEAGNNFLAALKQAACDCSQPLSGQELLLQALRLLLLAEKTPVGLSKKAKDQLVALLDQMSRKDLPPCVLKGVNRARRIHAESKRRKSASSWDYHTVSIPHLRLNVWGSFSASVGSRVFDARSFKRKKSMTLLALLATEIGCDFNRDFLVESLWPGSSLAHARRNFYAVWGDLRSTLCLEDGSCPYLVRSGLSYRLDDSLVECDIQEAERLCKCLRDKSASLDQWDKALATLTSRFTGELLPGAPVNDRLGFYCEAARAGIMDSLISAGQSLLDRGEEVAALRYARAVLGSDPHREDAYELVMKAQIRLGQRTSALNTYLSCQRLLSDDLGVDPSPAVYALYEEALGAVC
ncbi:MAG: bacterial transcriptional activator domain-containing protein [Eggerthellales bacterium]|nr:bacterial transcriptional activator domain-containing protein [Eggerthellales bacterium]